MRILSRIVAVAAFLLLCGTQANAASAVAVVTNGVGPGGTTLPVNLGIAQAGQFFYAYDPVSCASLASPTISTATAPVLGSLSNSAATLTIPQGQPCAGQTMSGVSVTYTPTAGIPDVGALLTAGGNYWQCGGVGTFSGGVDSSYYDCTQRAAQGYCASRTGDSQRNCYATKCTVDVLNDPPHYAEAFCYFREDWMAGSTPQTQTIDYEIYLFHNLPSSCPSNFASTDTASGCTGAAPIVTPSNLDPTKPDSYSVTATSADGTASTTSSMTPTPAGKDLGDCGCSASDSNSSEVSNTGGVSTGDPVSIGTGNMHESVVDYTTAGQNPLVYTRYYNSQALGASFAATMGPGWRSNYDRYLHVISSTNVAAERPDGKIVQFLLVSGAWVPDGDRDYALTQSGSTWSLTDHAGTVETYSAAISNGIGSGNSGVKLASITQRNGYAQTMGYNGSNQLATITDSYSRTLVLTYSGALLQTVTTPDSTTIAFSYTNNFLTGVSYSGSPATGIGYTYTNGFLTSVTDGLGQAYANWTYDSFGRGTSSWNGSASANLTSIVYNTDGSRTLTSPLGLVETYKFVSQQGSLKLSEIDRAASATTAAATRTFAYDMYGYLNAGTDWLGHTTSYLNRANGAPFQIIDRLNRVTNIQYDSAFPNLPDTITAPGITTAYTYDTAGEVLTRKDTDTTGQASNGQTRIWTYSWANGLVASVQNPRTDLTVKTLYGYDSSGAQTSTTDPLGHVTTVTSHTGGGRALSVTDPDAVVTTLGYDNRQRLISSSVATSGGARATAWTYDAAGDLTRTTLPDGSFTGWVYDSAHRVTGVTDNAGDTVSYTLNNAGDATATAIAPSGGTTTASSAATYDALGRRLTETPAGSGVATTYTYDSNGNVKSKTDGLGHATNYTTYDAGDRLTGATLPDSSTLTYGYDVQDRLTTYTTSQGAATSYSYDAWGGLLKYSPTVPGNVADDGGMTYLRDGDGNITKRTDYYGTINSWTYDAGDRPLTKTFPADTAENVAYTYDQTGTGFSYGIGRLTTMADQVGSVTYAYDERGNLLTETRASSTGGSAHSFVTSRTYDAAGRVASLTYPSSLTLTYTRDAMGEITGIANGSNTVISTATYLPFGPLSSLSYGNTIAETLSHDASYRATGVSDVGIGAVGVVNSLTYALDAADNVKTVTDNVTAANNQSFTYNTRDRVLTASGAYGAYIWTYDTNGNRSSEQLGSATATSYSYANDRVSQVGSTALGYMDGATVSVTPSGGPNSSFTLNKADRWAVNTVGGVGVETFLYDGRGSLFGRGTTTTPITFRQYLYGQRGQLLEEAQNNAAQADYIYLNDRPVAVYSPTTGTFSYLHDDRLGTPVAATNSIGAVVWSAAYAPFGQVYASTNSGSIVQDLRLAGQFAGPLSGRYHNGAREYNPAIGRYEQSDPINRMAGPNVYLYADGNPLKNIDPSGLDPQSLFGMTPADMSAAAAASYAGVPVTTGPSILGDYARAYASFMQIIAAPILGPEEVAAGGMCEAVTSSLYDTSVTKAGAKELNVLTDVGAQEFQSNLMSNGYKITNQFEGTNGPTTILSNGQSYWTLYIRNSTGESGALFNGPGGMIKYLLGGP